mmetsp:Transcript_16276/g.18822  ORF Transcript_16276/g.18822 Transcript_16276/m.18822 type:complete len:132 (+) Transcript_16276:303-698(+)
MKKIDIRDIHTFGTFLNDASTPEDIIDYYKKCLVNSTIYCTMMGSATSRAHNIFVITVESIRKTDGEFEIRKGMLSLVRLAGSERTTRARGGQMMLQEAQLINKSLASLSNVVHSLVSNHKFVPYRDSQLT